jgi:hypothetical protein
MSDSQASSSVTITVVRILTRVEADFTICCPDCNSELDLAQPAADDPDHLLATCEDCGAWYILAWLAGDEFGVMARLPDWAALHAAGAGLKA